jgi:hypothetical protein
VPVGDHAEHVVLILKFHPSSDGTFVVAKVQS